jgi:hypothetical protein
MTYSLRRISDGAGDSGQMSLVSWREDNGTRHSQDNGRPKVDATIRVGSFYARTYEYQDWWQTSLITEIIEDTPDMVRFKTKNSEYVWTKF